MMEVYSIGGIQSLYPILWKADSHPFKWNLEYKYGIFTVHIVGLKQSCALHFPTPSYKVPDTALFIPDQQWLTERRQCRTVPRTGLSTDFSHARPVTRHNRIPVLGNEEIYNYESIVPDLDLEDP